MESWGLHAVIYPKNKFSLEEAKANFAEQHKPKFMRETKSSYRYRVIPKTRFKQYRSKKLPNGSTLVYGELLPKWKHLSGSGFFGDVKNVAKNVITKIARVPGKIAEQFTRRHNYNNTSARTLDKHKDEIITKMVIVRTPIMAILDKVFNMLTFGSWAKAKEQAGYDKMFHLQLRINDILVEKNEVINITENLSSITDKSEQLIISSFPSITIGEFMKTGEDLMGSNYWLYDAFSNNCQNFIMGLLSANNCLSEEAKAFIYQPVEELVKRIPKYMGIIAKGATGIGAVANRLMGKGEVEDRKQKIKEQYLKEVAIGEKQNMKGIAWRKRLREDGALKAKVYEDAKTMPIDNAYRDRVMGFSDNVVNGGSQTNYQKIGAMLGNNYKKFNPNKMKNPSKWIKKKYAKPLKGTGKPKDRTPDEQVEYNIRKAIKKDLIEFILSRPELADLYEPKPPKIKGSKKIFEALDIKAKDWNALTNEERKESLSEIDPLIYKSKSEIVAKLRNDYTAKEIKDFKIRLNMKLSDLIDAIKEAKIYDLFE